MNFLLKYHKKLRLGFFPYMYIIIWKDIYIYDYIFNGNRTYGRGRYFMYKINFEQPVHVHFIGIGGISMSGLAEILLKEGLPYPALTTRNQP